MCGIAGIISFSDKKVSQRDLKAMTDIVAHRGPDGEGHYFSEDGKVALGHRRLSIIDLSEAASQPMTFDEHTIIFNGEIYNYIEVREELKSLGRACITASDTEVIIRAYQQWGEDCVHKFNGMWAFAIHDKKKNIVFCSRDRFGIKPFYYYENKGCFYFASEIKEFTVIENWQAKLNLNMTFEYLQYGYHQHGNDTFFNGVKKLGQGSKLIFDLNQSTYTTTRYYDLKIKNLNTSDYISKFKEYFSNAVNLRLRADVKVGTALSGGLDSSAVVYCLNNSLKKIEKEHLQETVSAVYDEALFDESRYINVVKDDLDIINHKKNLTFSDVMEDLDKTIWHMDEPFSSMSMVAGYNVFKEAHKNGIKVMLNGQGADEILGGYDKFYKIYFESLMREGKYIKAVSSFISYFKLHNVTLKYVIGEASKFIKKFNNKKDSSWLKLNQNATNLFKRPAEDTFFDVSYNLIYNLGMPALLHYEDRNSMAHSVEARVPFLDFNLVEFAVSLPNEVKINNAVRKYVLREAFKMEFPDAIYKRYDKLGFVTPQQLWMKEQRSIFIEELKDFPHKFPFVNKIAFDQMLSKYQKEELNDDLVIWRLFIFQRWLTIFNLKY